jgi:outer membrane protein
MKKIIGISLALSLSLFSKQLELDDLIQKALENSPDIKISQAQYKSSVQRTKQADADYLPQLNLNAEAGRQSVDYKDQKIDIGPGRQPIEIGKTDTDLLLGSLDAKQLIYDFGKTTGNIQTYSNIEKSNKFSMQQTISDKIFAVKKAYYNLLVQYALIGVNEENVKLNKQQLYRSEEYFKAGIRTKVDITDAQVNLIKANLALNNTKYDTKTALVNLAKELGVKKDINSLDIYIQVPDLKDAYNSLVHLNYNEDYYISEALSNRAELKKYQQLLNAAKAKHSKVTGDYYPSMYANGQYMLQDADHDAFVPEEQWKATVSVEWNLFAGNRTKAQSEEARIDILKAQSDLDNVELMIKQEVSDAFINVNRELDNTKLSQSLTISSQEKFIQVGQRYEHGLADFIELQEARQTYIDSLADLAQSYYKYYIAIAQLDNAIGK